MFLGKLANIGFPAKILTVDEWDGLISLLIGLMVLVCVESRFWGSVASLGLFLLYFLLFYMGLVDLLFGSALSLHLSLLDWLCSNFILCSDNCNLDGVRLSLDWDSLLHLVMGLLLGIKAVDLVLVHAILFFADSWNSLNETDHGFIALGVEFAIVTRFNAIEFLRALSLWQGGYLRLDCVLEVGQEPKTVFELDLKRLVVYCWPGAYQVLLGTVYSIFAEDGLDLELVHQLDFPDVLLGEGELMVLWQDL